jgi:hypothetical protein
MCGGWLENPTPLGAQWYRSTYFEPISGYPIAIAIAIAATAAS